MEEEKKEVVEEAEEVKEEEKVAEPEPVEAQQPERVDDEADLKNALISFILAAAGFVFAATGLALLICGIISKSFGKKIQGKIEKKPHAIFQKVAKIAAPIEIIVGIVIIAAGLIALLVWIIILIVAAVGAAGAAAAEGAIAVLPLL